MKAIDLFWKLYRKQIMIIISFIGLLVYPTIIIRLIMKYKISLWIVAVPIVAACLNALYFTCKCIYLCSKQHDVINTLHKSGVSAVECFGIAIAGSTARPDVISCALLIVSLPVYAMLLVIDGVSMSLTPDFSLDCHSIVFSRFYLTDKVLEELECMVSKKYGNDDLMHVNSYAYRRNIFDNNGVVESKIINDAMF